MIIAFTVSGQRQEYLRRSLESWSRARGIEKARLLFLVEPDRSFPVPDFKRWVSTFPCPVEVIVHPERLGILENTRQAFTRSFAAGAEFAVLAEEDIVVATDVVEYLTWASQHGDDDTVMACAHSKDAVGEEWQVTRASWFSPLVCGTWPGQWESFIRPSWGGLPPNDRGIGAPDAWDSNLRLHINSVGKHCLFPVLSRANHIGEYSTWLRPGTSSYLYPGSTSQSFRPEYAPQEYREVRFDDVPSIIV